MDFHEYYSINRTLCQVLKEARQYHKTRNYANLLSLLEESEDMGLRMLDKLINKKSKDRNKGEV
jgi:hypothetical protein